MRPLKSADTPSTPARDRSNLRWQKNPPFGLSKASGFSDASSKPGRDAQLAPEIW